MRDNAKQLRQRETPNSGLIPSLGHIRNRCFEGADRRVCVFYVRQAVAIIDIDVGQQRKTQTNTTIDNNDNDDDKDDNNDNDNKLLNLIPKDDIG